MLKAKLILGIVLIAISIGLFVYIQIVINSAFPEYNYHSYTGFRFPNWYGTLIATLGFAGLLLIFWNPNKTKQKPSQNSPLSTDK
jgi:hypothetical protein